MCGLSGSLYFESEKANINISRKMISELHHRGPDNLGELYIKNDGLIFNHTRLSIIDTSDQGNQPMTSFSGRWSMIFNGEIYNYKKIQNNILQSYNLYLKGKSDSEILLSAIENLGLEKTIQIIDGMFAICLWDSKEKNLYLIRDRIGEKPLYYSFNDESIIFASELKSFSNLPNFQKSLSIEALNFLLKIGFIPSNKCIYKNINKLIPGEILKINKYDKKIIKRKYWDIKNIISTGTNTASDNIDNIENLINESVKDRLNSDVPIGTLLSGGIDSSLITYYAQNNSINKIKTFSIGFNEDTHDESLNAKEVANFLNTDHNHLYFEKTDIINFLPKIHKVFCEPIVDSSQIPTFLISKLISNHLKVALSGDGGDELFGGYNRHIYFTILKKLNLLPNFIKKLLFSKNNSKILKTLSYLLSAKIGEPETNTHDKIIKFFNVIQNSPKDINYINVICNNNSLNILERDFNHDLILENEIKTTNHLQDLLINDLNFYLPDDILTKVDRASMYNSIEIRSPFISRKLVETSFLLNNRNKIRNFKGKIVLRKLMEKNYNNRLANLPKKGFSIPLKKWIRGDLNYWAKDIFFSKSKCSHFFNNKMLNQIWHDFNYNNIDYSEQIWSIIVFKQWYENQ